MQSADGSGQILWMWGEIQKALGRLETGQLANRQTVLDQGIAMRQRQDDMRREIMTHIARLDRREGVRRRMGWLRHVPWDRVLIFLATSLGALGWVKPEWIRLLARITGAP